MNKDVWKIAGAVLAIIILSLIILRPRPLQKYRESNQIGSQLISIDMCVDKGADTKRTARTGSGAGSGGAQAASSTAEPQARNRRTESCMNAAWRNAKDGFDLLMTDRSVI